jgi:hypothetical protein
MAESITLRPTLADAPAVVAVVDNRGHMQLYPLPLLQADTLRRSLGAPAWDAEGEEGVTQMIETLAAVARKRGEVAGS